jgi:kynurenine formamidase
MAPFSNIQPNLGSSSSIAVLLVMAFAITSCNQQQGPASLSFPEGSLVDMSYAYNENTIYWPTAPGFVKSTDFEGVTEGGFYYTAYSFSSAEHGGTHLDAPVHFAEGKHSNDQIPLESLMGNAIVIDVQVQAAENRDYLISTADIATWEAENGAIPDGSIVLFRTGFGKFWPDRESYMGTAVLGPEGVALLHFPGIDPSVATLLATERTIKAVGIDTPSIDFGQSTLFETHQNLFSANIPAFENVANLDKLPVTGALVIALPMKIEGGSGGPLRMVGIIPNN